MKHLKLQIWFIVLHEIFNIDSDLLKYYHKQQLFKNNGNA